MKHSAKKLKEIKRNAMFGYRVNLMIGMWKNVGTSEKTVFCLYRRMGKLKIRWLSTIRKTKIIQERRVDHHQILHDSAVNLRL